MSKSRVLFLSLLLAGSLAACSNDEDSGSGGRGSGSGGGDGDSLSGGFGNAGEGNGGAGTGGGTNQPEYHGTDFGCAPRPATMWFVVDGSGSMDDGFGAGTRWTTLRTSLLDADGAIAKLHDVVNFGLLIYDGPIDIGAFLGMPTPGLCPQLVTVPTAPMNYGPIDAAFPQGPLGGSTPTHQGMEAVRGLIQQDLANPDNAAREQYIILATDGAPNSFCDGMPDPPGAVIQQTQMALQESVKTYVISLAGGDANLTAHLNQVADAGGTGMGVGGPGIFVPDNKEALVQALREIVTASTGCDLLAPE